MSEEKKVKVDSITRKKRELLLESLRKHMTEISKIEGLTHDDVTVYFWKQVFTPEQRNRAVRDELDLTKEEYIELIGGADYKKIRSKIQLHRKSNKERKHSELKEAIKKL